MCSGSSGAYLPQEMLIGMSGSVYEIVASGAGISVKNSRSFTSLRCRVRTPLNNGPSPLCKRSYGWQIQPIIERVIDQMRLNADADFSMLSGGMRRQGASCPRARAGTGRASPR